MKRLSVLVLAISACAQSSLPFPTISCVKPLDCPPAAHATAACASSSCVSECAPGWADCDASFANGCEVDIRSSPLDCGRCHHDCLGGLCADGRCQPVVLASGLDQPRLIAVEGRDVYWTNAGRDDAPTGSVMKRTLGVGPPDPVAVAQNRPFDVAVDAHSVYWSNRGREGSAEGSLMTIPRAGGTPSILASGQAGPVSIALDGGELFWANYSSGEVSKVATTGGPISVLATQPDHAGGLIGIALDATSIYFTNRNRGVVWGLARAGGAARILAMAPNPRQIVAFGDRIFWTSENGQVDTAEIAGNSFATIADAQNDPYDIAVDHEFLYWTSTGNGTVMRTALDGSGQLAIATDQASPYGIAVDESAVYWTNYGDGSVMRLARLP